MSGAGALRGSADRHERVASRDAHGLRAPADVLDVVVRDQALPDSGAALPARLPEARRAVGGYPPYRLSRANQDAWASHSRPTTEYDCADRDPLRKPRLRTIEHGEQLAKYLIRAVLDVVKYVGDIG